MRRGDAAVAADISVSNVTPLIDADNALQLTSESHEQDEVFRTAIKFAPHLDTRCSFTCQPSHLKRIQAGRRSTCKQVESQRANNGVVVSHVLVRGKLIVPEMVTGTPPEDTESTILTPSTHSFTVSLCVTLMVCTPAVVGWNTALYRTENLRTTRIKCKPHAPAASARKHKHRNAHFISPQFRRQTRRRRRAYNQRLPAVLGKNRSAEVCAVVERGSKSNPCVS
jgi:hypothetical protein